MKPMALWEGTLCSPSSIVLLSQCMLISKGSFPSVITNNGIKYLALSFMHDFKNLYLPLITTHLYEFLIT